MSGPQMYKMRTPSLFIQHQITNLRVLTELLAAHIDGLPMPSAVSREALLCRESMLTISVLLPKLEATRQALQPVESRASERQSSVETSYQPLDEEQPSDEDETLRQRLRVCENCD